MLFTKFEFLFYFLPFVYFINEKFFRNSVFFLIAASLTFYSLWDIKFLPLLVVSVIGNYHLSRLLNKYKTKSLVFFIISLNLLPLIYYKYSRFFLSSMGVNLEPIEGYLPNILPLGISFYTFQQIAYIVDLYRGVASVHKLKNYFFFTTFFPHLISGPLLHHKTIIEQIDENKDRASLFHQGMLYLLLGLGKKILIADTLAGYIDPLYTKASTEVLTFWEAFISTFGYSFRLYFDFSGYSDIAVGLGLLFGYRLPINFNSPYKAKSIQDFWRRWHITLSSFLRDYVYISLGGNRKGFFRQNVNLFIVMFVGGLWHGANWTFVVWGATHGTLLIIENCSRRHFPNFSFGRLSPILTFLAVCFLWVVFRAESMSEALNVYKGFFTSPYVTYDYVFWMLILSTMLTLLPNSHFWTEYIYNKTRGFSVNIQKVGGRVPIYSLIGYVTVSAVILLFYTTEFDRNIYKKLNVVNPDYFGIANENGDYRSNLLTNHLLISDLPKIAFVGSSFVGSMGNFQFTHNNKKYISGTIGIGGNSLLNGLVAAAAILDDPQLEVLILGIHALNCGNINEHQKTFAGECCDKLLPYGINQPSKPLSAFHHKQLNFKELRKCIKYSKKDIYQFRGFLHKVKKYSFNKDPHSEFKALTLNTLQPGENSAIFFKAAYNPTTEIQNPTNGADKDFNWKNRNIFQSLEATGQVYSALKTLNSMCEKKGIRFILYDTPTVKHTEAPHIFPEGFYENYLSHVKTMSKEIGIEYYDFSDQFQWRGSTYYDFIHLTPHAREALHKDILETIFRETEN